MTTNSSLLKVDHLIYGAPDLQTGVEQIERLLGVRASIGGKHIGLGTHNALISLGSQCYLEIIAPDPEQEEFRRPLLFGLDLLSSPRLVRWVAKGDHLEQLSFLNLGRGESLGMVSSGGRMTPEGYTLTWSFTDPYVALADGIVPFFIDWGQSPHPADSAPQGAVLRELNAEHPDPDYAQSMLDQLGLAIRVSAGRRAALVAVIDSPRGQVVLR